ncbi:MAG TPA: purine nucleoside permease [Acidobacteriaceae bacterium]|jgi:purine nucleoside permease|nr:purine nucleoside permease [Acidobacteriaceae bacterium]
MRLLRRCVFLLCPLAACILTAALPSGALAQTSKPVAPWPIRAVIVTTFEVGNDTGDVPGEFQLWAEREHLDEIVPFPGGAGGPHGSAHPLRTNKDHTVLGMVSGTTLVNATASMMALGLDPRFDLTHAYFLINGIAGVDPAVASMGSAAWAEFVVGDVAREIDPREAPKSWPYGIFPTNAKEPNPKDLDIPTWHRSNLYTLNPKLVHWAFAQTRSLPLGDDPKVAAFRAGYKQPAAQRPPFVLLGDTFASDYYWHGSIMTQYARDWVKLWTRGKGTFAMTEMEDSGFMEALERLDAMHRVDRNRALVLRTGSNYSMERPGHDAVESVSSPYIGGRLALESSYTVGSAVLHHLTTHWDTTRDHIPGE